MKRVFGIALVCALCVALGLFVNGQVARAEIVQSGACGDNLTWTLDDEGTLTISGTGNMTSHPWSADAVNTVVIEEGVTSIGYRAFDGCSSLTSITIPEGVTSIGNDAFRNCSSLTSITIPEGVTSIGEQAFFGCTSLNRIEVEAGNQAYSSIDGVMFDKNGSALLCCPGGRSGQYTIPTGVTSIGRFAFYNCSSLTSITIPDGVTSIGDATFSYCGARLYANLDTDGAKALSKSGYSFRVPGTNYNLQHLYTNEIITGLRISHVDKDVTAFTIPDGVTSIGSDAFYNCSSLTSITIPDSVTRIGNDAFSYCSSLTSITIPDSVTSIGYATFSYCGARLYANLDTDGAKALSKLGYSFRVPGTNYNLQHLYTNEIITGLRISHVDKDVTAFTIPEGVTSIGSDAFSDCSKLISITIPNSVTSIGDYAFSDCSRLESITIPSSVTSIGDYAFSDCSRLESITIPSSVTSIGSLAFYTISNPLKHLCVLSETITIPDDLFYIIDTSYPTIYCYMYSDMDIWATDRNLNVVYLDDLDPDSIRELSLQEDFKLAVGQSQDLVKVLFPSYDNPEITWDSTEPSVVSVSNGTVTALSAGKAMITASVGNASDSVEITAYISVESFDLNETEAWVVAKDALQLMPVNLMPEGAEATFEWESSDTNLATVDASGLVTTKKPGDVTITATSDNGITRECLIHLCYPVTTIAFEPETITLKKGQSCQMTAYVTARTQSFVNKLVTFETSDAAVATVDADGRVTAKGVGTATITATAANGVSASCEITVQEPSVLTLPAGLAIIEDEAFMGDDAIEAVIVPDGCQMIGAKAFANCPNLIYIRIPASITSIAEDAFEGSNQVRIDRAEKTQ